MIDPKAIKELKVYPPIGIARVGNAPGPDDYVIGPETIGGPPTLPGSTPELPARYVDHFRTIRGEIKRQAARFRVYAHMKDGSVQEITAASATIEWRVAVANLKAGWYEFNQAMDIPSIAQPAPQRNSNLVSPENRARLDIVPVPQSISGANAPPVPLKDGKFFDRAVYVGELRTDRDGRLIFLGGKGVARPARREIGAFTFANNPGWHDDLCDGPVWAKVTFPGQQAIDAEPGYVSVTPPNYAPGLFGLVTMDDVVREVFYDQTWLERPTSTSFADDVLPVFQRLTGLQWVNHGLFVLHGFGSSLDAQNPNVVAKLANPSAANAAWRKRVFDLFRDPNASGATVEARLPQIYGDGVEFNDATALLAITSTMYAHLTRWAAGNFTAGVAAAASGVVFPALAPEQQVQHLERASLHDCLGGPFHPAMEITWVLRIPRLWKSAYRLKILPGERPARQDFGDVLTPAVCIGAGGPYDGAAAGCLTRFLGVPWHTDHTSCNSAADYAPGSFLSMPTFWGPRAPDQVLADGNFMRAAALTRKEDSGQQVWKHLMYRVDWLRDIRGTSYYDRLAFMIREWAELGMVLPVKGASEGLPIDLRVEQGRPIDVTKDEKFLLAQNVEDLFDARPTIALEATALEAPAKSRIESIAAPSKRTYRQGQI